MARAPYSRNSYTGGATPAYILGSGIGAADTTLTFSGTGTTWTTLGSGGGFNLSLQYGLITEEKIFVASGSYNWAAGSLTISGVTRGIDGTTAQVHPSGSSVTPVVTGVDFQEANYLVNSSLFPLVTSSGYSLASTGSGVAYTPAYIPGSRVNYSILNVPIEKVNIINASINSNVNLVVDSGNTYYYQQAATNNFTVNITSNAGIYTSMGSGQSITTSILNTTGVSIYALASGFGLGSPFFIDNYAVPSGNVYYGGGGSNVTGSQQGIDLYTFTALRNNLNYDIVVSGYNPDVWFKLNDPLTTNIAANSSTVTGYSGNYSGNIIQMQQGFNPAITADTSAYFYAAGQNIVSTNYIPNWGNAQSFTINAWIKNSYSGYRQDFISAYLPSTTGTNQGFSLFVNAAGYLQIDNVNVGGTTSAKVVADNNWHMVTLQATNTSANNTTYQLYVDGAANGSSVNMNSNFTGPATLTLGQAASISQFNGYMSQVSVFKSALSAAQISTLYQAGAPYTILAQKTTTSGAGVPYSGLYPFSVGTSVTFTPGGATLQNGPSLAQMIAGMSSNQSLSWNTNTNYFNSGTFAGYQLWTVPTTGTYRIAASGAGGGYCSGYSVYGGDGAYMQGDFNLTQGQYLTILVGQQGVNNGTHSQGGQQAGSGGGTFIVLGNNATAPTSVLLIAGGGGGAYGWSNSPQSGLGANTSTTGTNAGGGNAGTGGNAGGYSNSGSGAGYSGSGNSNSGPNPSTYSFLSGGRGGQMATNWGDYGIWGGFGGGGGGGLACGGGGGYSGGSSGIWSSPGAGGGGGSYNSGANQVNYNGANGNINYTKHGSVTITRLS